MQGENVVVTATGFDKVQNFTWFVLQTCHGRDFLVTLKRISENSSFKQFFAVVVLVGSSKDASRFQYRLNLCGSDQRLTFEGSMRDIRSLVECVQNGNGLIFSTSTAERLFGGGDLKMDITITFHHAGW
nr:E3 ubiquitin-protein ligase sina-like [Rhipicephalus microplus]